MTITREADRTGRPEGRWSKWAGPALGLLIFVVAAVVISGEFRTVRWHDVDAAVRATSQSALILALVALAVSLLAASSFDRLAIASLGKKATWKKTSETSVIAFALANAGPPGLAAAAGVRYRAYRNDLSGTDIAVISAIGTGIALVGGLALIGVGTAGVVSDIASRAHLPHWISLIAGALGLKLLAVYMLSPRIGWLNRVLPERKIRLAIVLSSAIEWAAAAAILYILLPAGSRGDLWHFLPVFGLAGLVGALSGLPGGIGAFDVVVLAVLGPAVGTADVAGALILYRLVYGLGPLLVAGGLTAMGAVGFPGRIGSGDRVLAAGEALWRDVAPGLFALLTFASGLVTLLSAATPDGAVDLRILDRLAPSGLVDLSHFAASLTGVVLLFLAFGLLSRLRRAWWMTLVALAMAAVACVLKGLGYGEALFLATVAALLAVSRSAFHRDARLADTSLSPGAVMAIIVVLGAVGWLGLFAYRDVAYRDDLWWTFLTEQNAPRFLRAAVGASVLTVLLFAWQLTQPGKNPPAPASAAELAKVAEILKSAENVSPDANLAYLGDKALMFTASGRSFVQFGVRGRAWVAMGEPVGPQSERSTAIWAFRELCDRYAGRPVFYGVRRQSLPEFIDCGLVASKIGESAVVELAGFSMEGSQRAPLRHVVNRAARDGVSCDIVPPEGFDAIATDLETVSDAWLALHQGTEKGFSLGRFDRNYLRRFPTAVLRHEDRIVAFANLWRTSDGRTLSIDLMRYAPDAPRNSMDFLFIQLMLWGRDNGFFEFDLGMAPLSGLAAHRLSPSVTRVGSFVYSEGGGLYGFEGLRAFKQKFDPRWDPVYIVAPAGWMLGPALADAALLSSGGLLGVFR